MHENRIARKHIAVQRADVRSTLSIVARRNKVEACTTHYCCRANPYLQNRTQYIGRKF